MNDTFIQGMRRAGKLAAQALAHTGAFVKPGVTTEQLDDIAREYIHKHGAVPASLNYLGFPKSICTSVNHVICHGIPGPKKLQEGDIVNLDVAVILDGYHGDTSITYPVGKVGVKAAKLIAATQAAMMAGIEAVKPGEALFQIGAAIQASVKPHGYGLVREYVGHGVGLIYHTWPTVWHWPYPNQDPIIMHPGMTFTVEPMVNIGGAETKMLDDGWTVVTRDKSLSAQFEHSVLVTETGYEILTSI